jgi:hypothetical protein
MGYVSPGMRTRKRAASIRKIYNPDEPRDGDYADCHRHHPHRSCPAPHLIFNF